MNLKLNLSKLPIIRKRHNWKRLFVAETTKANYIAQLFASLVILFVMWLVYLTIWTIIS